MEPLSTTTLGSSSSSKRGRAPSSSGNQVASCLVDGCNADLSKCRDYHRRHKVCEVHSKTPKVTIGGQEQRFCQQCSRFHSLGEFDEGKRSCRKRLEGHNRRRRKPQPESLPLNPASFLSAAQGSRFLPFTGSAMIHSTSVVSPSAWSGSIKPAETTPPPYGSCSRGQSSISAPYSSNSFGGRQFPFFQGVPDSPLPGSSSSSAHQRPLHDPGSIAITTGSSSSSGNSNQNHNKLFCNGLTTHQPVITDIITDRALSLLSSSPAAAAAAAAAAADTHDLGFSRMMHHHHHHPQTAGPARPLVSSLHYGSSVAHYPGHHHPHHGLDHDVEGGGSAGLHFSDVFHANSHDGSSASGPHQTLSFSWE